MNTIYEEHSLENKKPYIYHNHGTGFQSHWHENIEILHFKSSGKILCDRTEFFIPKGGFAVIGSDVMHTVNTQSKSFYDCFIPDSNFCTENGIDVSALEFKCSVSDGNLEKLYKILTDEIENPHAFSDAGTKAAILNFMVYLCRNYGRPKKNGVLNDLNIKKAVTYINSKFTEHLTIEEIASNAALSKYYFCREFKKATGFSVIKYINMKRCHTAEKLLATKKYNVSEAASAVGYDNLSYFTRTFKNITGHLPGEYKK